MTIAYDPLGRFEIKVWDTEFRRTPARQLMALVYQPQGDGPFPALLDLHGGVWNNQDRTANAPMDESRRRNGILVVAIDLTGAPRRRPSEVFGTGSEIWRPLVKVEVCARMERTDSGSPRSRAGLARAAAHETTESRLRHVLDPG